MSESVSMQDDIPLIDLLNEADRREGQRDPVFFINHFLMTFDPRPELAVHDIDFILYPFQEEYVYGLVEAIRTGHDVFDEKSRDMGASWLALAVRFWMWLYDDGYQSLLGSRKEEYVDSGTYKSLFGKLDYFIRNIKDPLVLPKGFDIKKHRTYMRLINPENGNVIEGESSNKNFSRAGRYKDILYDEFGFWPDARSSWTAGGDATRCRHAVTTPPDEPSYAKALRFSGKINVRTWHWRLHPNKDMAWYEYEKGRRTEEEVLHELDISWEYSGVGKPYPEIKFVQFGQFGYDATLPLYVSIDLGLDAVAIGYYQPVRNSNYITLVDAYENYGKLIDWYAPMFGKDIDSRFTYTDDDLEFINMVKMWKGGIFYGDPSGKSKHIESNVSPYEILRNNYGITVQTNDLENDWPSRRDAAKRVLSNLRINDTPRTRWFVECVSSARYPKRDEETSQSVTPISKPVHDWTSHHRTELEFFSVNYNSQDSGDPNSYVSSPYAQAPSNVAVALNGIGLNTGLDAILNRDNGPTNDWML